jgi:flagellar hook-associated protein 3 FlgL
VAATPTDRKSIARQPAGLRDDLLAVANRQDGTGRYLFGGQGNGGTKPCWTQPPAVTYAATGGLPELGRRPGDQLTPLMLDGALAFMQAPDPAAPGHDLGLRRAGQVATELDHRTSGPRSLATDQQWLGASTSWPTTLSSWRSPAGEAEPASMRLGDRAQPGQARRADRALQCRRLWTCWQAISDFQNQQTGYDAALKTYSIVQRMSLFDYIK